MPELPWDTPLDEVIGFSQALNAVAESGAAKSSWHKFWVRLVIQYDIDVSGINVVRFTGWRVWNSNQIHRKARRSHHATVSEGGGSGSGLRGEGRGDMRGRRGYDRCRPSDGRR